MTMAYINRAMEATFKRMAQEFSVILLTGPRQVGKTTMLKRLAEAEGVNREYVTLDDITEREMAKNDPKLFLQLHKPPVFIDEVQYAPELFPYIKKAGDFWLTGSQIFKLMDGVQESLAGRVCLLHMSPLSQAEACGCTSEPFTVEFERLLMRSKAVSPASIQEVFERIWRGGMPAIVSGVKKEQAAVYSSYISTYIDRDVKEIADRVDSFKFLNFVTVVAALTSQMVNYKTMNILERLGIIFYLHPYSNNLLKRMVTKPKLYFYDSGLVAYLTKWTDSETLMNGAMSGAILENFVVSEIVKSYQNAGLEPFVYYYRDKDNKEIDIVLERNGTLYPLEVKKTMMPDKRWTNVFGVLDKTSLKRGTGGILCLSDKFTAFDRDNLIIPVWEI